MMSKNFPFHFAGIAGLFLIQVFCIYHFEGTGDSGDSVQHYLFARYAPEHPALFFDHWAKPLYVLIASSFAQFGFIGVKWMNVVLLALTTLLTTAVAKQLKMKQSNWIFLFQYFAPFCFAMTFSGLTEYMFAFFLSLSLFLQFRKQFLWAALVVSFLPFVRSEGLFFVGIFMTYYIWQKNWKATFLLLTGHVVYSIAGFFVYSDFLWIFERNPYAKLHSTYGKGSLFHFVGELYYVLGLALYLLLFAGILRSIIALVRRKMDQNWLFFVFGSFLVFFAAHTLFWYFGIFNSMGLKRVFIAVLPLMSLMMLFGFNWIAEISLRLIRLPLTIGTIAFIAVFPFLDNPTGLQPKRDLELRPDQIAANRIGDQLKTARGRVFYNHPSVSMGLQLDPFDQQRSGKLSSPDNGQSGDILIWDSWFSVIEAGIKENTMKNSDKLQFLFEVNSTDNLSRFAVYRRM